MEPNQQRLLKQAANYMDPSGLYVAPASADSRHHELELEWVQERERQRRADSATETGIELALVASPDLLAKLQRLSAQQGQFEVEATVTQQGLESQVSKLDREVSTTRRSFRPFVF